MDKGAHFHRCDFQVHTPRDRQWNGTSATTDNERRAYAREFVAACRQRHLNAVGVTDHHDMAFIPFLREAAEQETDGSGAPISPADKLAIFPGMELTLGVPCQALLLFDSEFPDDLFTLALTALAIAPAPSIEERSAATSRLHHITSLEKLQEELDKHSFLRGRFTVLPNVSEGGSSTLLRAGHAGHYLAMPCVGGYLDGDICQLGNGNQRILSGQDTQYGSKALGLFQTSDNRRRDFADLGRSSTWVKWAEPTAEALRQACLARDSRLSHVEPLIPSTGVTAINVSNSLFMGPLFLELNPQYNAFIGGRGTGKSTILEYIRWALCDGASNAEDVEDLPGDQARRRKLVERTLTPLKSIVLVNFTVNGVPHAVRRNSVTNELALKIGMGPFEPCTESDIRALLPIQAYSQKQLSNVGVRLDELRRFVHAPVRKELEDILTKLGSTASEIRSVYARVRAKHQLEREIENEDRELRSLNEQTNAIRADLGGISEADRKLLEAQVLHEVESDIVGGWAEDLARATAALTGVRQALAGLPTMVDPANLEKLPNTALLEQMRSSLVERLRQAQQAVVEQLNQLSTLGTGNNLYAESALTWDQRHQQFGEAYAAAKSRSTTHQTKLDQLNALESRGKEIRTRLTSKRSSLASAGAPEGEMSGARETWCKLHEQRADLLATQCRTLTELSDGQIRATLVHGGSADAITEKLKSLLTGANIRAAKIEELAASFASSRAPVRQLQRVMHELESLALLDPEDGVEQRMPKTPLLIAAGFTERELVRMARKISPEAWVDLSVVPLSDQPTFAYRLREDDYIPFADASAGQQATSLLWALLNQDGPPLLIDQPEDDLDNQVLLKIVEQIWGAKQRRQLICSSHNANLVVNGDADLVIACDYRVAGEQAGGTIKLQGAIDVRDVRNEIATVMEGGRAAFRLRKEKYGF